MSFGVTVTTRPVTGGIVRVWPMCRSFLFLRSFAHQTVIIETSNLAAMPTSVSPGFTRYVRSRSLPSSIAVSTAIGLSSVPSSRNGPSTASVLPSGTTLPESPPVWSPTTPTELPGPALTLW